jgi:catechol 2,3-dioxygenase-like lactoylglutathione lyase family enzyme
MSVVRSIRHLALQTPDIDDVRGFGTAFGLDVADRGNDLVMRCQGREQDQIRVREAAKRGVHHVQFGVEPGALEDFSRRVELAGIKLHDAPDGGDEGGVWLRDPDGHHIHVVDTPEAEPRPFPYWPVNFGGRNERVDIAQWEVLPTEVHPRRLMHALIFASDINASERFYQEVLGLRLSDRIPAAVTFMNGTRGDHHIFGLVRSDRPGIHHVAWEVDNVDSVVVGAAQMAENGYRDGWGLGRHNLGSNYFHYTRGPRNLWFEYSCDIDQVTEAWQGTDQKVKPWAWGPPAPHDFTDNTVFPETVTTAAVGDS